MNGAVFFTKNLASQKTVSITVSVGTDKNLLVDGEHKNFWTGTDLVVPAPFVEFDFGENKTFDRIIVVATDNITTLNALLTRADGSTVIVPNSGFNEQFPDRAEKIFTPNETAKVVRLNFVPTNTNPPNVIKVGEVWIFTRSGEVNRATADFENDEETIGGNFRLARGKMVQFFINQKQVIKTTFEGLNDTDLDFLRGIFDGHGEFSVQFLPQEKREIRSVIWTDRWRQSPTSRTVAHGFDLDAEFTEV